jgi:peptidoglycan/LPS O-acetylase OafA/YrhL
MDCLAAGSLIALLWPTLQKKVAARPGLRREIAAVGAIAVAIALGAMVWMAAHGITTSLNSRLGNTLIYSCSLVCVVYVLLLALFGYLQPLFTLRPLTWLGTISYSVYLTHLGLLYYLREPLHFQHAEIWAMILTVVWGTASWHLMEKPLLRLGRGDTRTVTTQFRPAAH